MPKYFYCLIYLLCAVLSVGYCASRKPSIDHQQWVTLSVDGQQVGAVYLAPLKAFKGSLIIIQGDDNQGYERPIVTGIRAALPAKSWATLGLNIPNPKQAGKSVSPEKQLNQAVMFLKNKGAPLVYVLLYGRGAAELLTHLASSNGGGVEGVILLSGYSQDEAIYQKLLTQNNSWQTPVLDIVGEFDFPVVKSQAKLRNRLFSNHQAYYFKREVMGARHDYDHADASVTRWIYGWMMRRSDLTPYHTKIMR